MKEKKVNKRIIWFIIILVLLVLGLSSFFIYDKISNKHIEVNQPINNNDNEEIFSLNEVYKKLKYNDIVNDDTLLFKGVVSDIETKANVNIGENYSNIIYNQGKFKFVFNCLATDRFGATEEIECSEREIIVNDKIKINLYGQIQYLFLTNKFTIVQIYDQQVNLEEIIIYNNENGLEELSFTNSYINGDTGVVKINNNRLYYISADSESINSLNTLSVDLSDANLKSKKLDSYKIRNIKSNIINKLEIEIIYNNRDKIKNIELKIKANDKYNYDFIYEGFNIYKYEESMESLCDMSSNLKLSDDYTLDDKENYVIEIEELKIKNMIYSESMWSSIGTTYINGNPLEQIKKYCSGSKYETNDSHSLTFLYSNK